MEHILESNFPLFNTNPRPFRLIDCYLSKPSNPHFLKEHQIKCLLYQTLQEFELNEIETVVWLFVLDYFQWKSTNFSFKLVLCFTALKSKQILSINIEADLKKLEKKVLGASELFCCWCRANIMTQEITLVEINRIYKRLTLPIEHDIINYNCYVDDLLSANLQYFRHKVGNLKQKGIQEEIEFGKCLDVGYNDIDFPKID